MYRVIINTKILQDYENLSNKQKEYIHTLFKLSELSINPSQIEVVETKDISNEIPHYLNSLFSKLNTNELFIYKDSHIKVFYITFMDAKGKIHKVFTPTSFLINEEKFNSIRYDGYCHILNYTQTSGIVKSISYRYNLTTTNVTFTNEIKKDTRINFLQDKNYMIKINSTIKNQVISKNNFVINPNIYKEFISESSLFPLEHLFELFNVDKKKLKRSLEKISYIPNKFIVLGMGGTMGNFFYWIKQFQEYFDLPYVFKKLIVFEKDKMEFHNAFRIPLLLKEEYDSNPQSKNYLFLYNCKNISSDIRTRSFYFDITMKDCYKHIGSSIFIGTPDIPTRQTLEQHNIKFFCPTHQNNTIKIVETPVIDGALFYETYGSIDLNKFLLNMFNMSINLIYTLAENSRTPLEKNKLHFQQSFDEINFIENSKKSKILKNIAYAIN